MRCQWLAKRDIIVANLQQVFAQALPADIVAGERWYPEARRIVREWSQSYGYTVETVANVVAAISPQVDWNRNLIIADDVLAKRPVSIGGALPANLRKAERLRDGEFPSMLHAFPGGPKVNCFALNLAGDDIAVTIDTHCIQAALNDVQSTVTLKWGAPYSVFAACFEQAARRAHRPNAEYQAIVWHVWKRLHPRERKRVLRRRWDAIGEF